MKIIINRNGSITVEVEDVCRGEVYNTEEVAEMIRRTFNSYNIPNGIVYEGE